MLPSRLLAPLAAILIGSCAQTCWAWDSGDLEIFDLVEELGTVTFYQLLEVQQDATAAEVRRAYRKLSLRFHPDKTREEGAEEKFRQVAAVAEILRDEEKRAIYDRVLVEGLPNWRQPVFYYRQVRRMGTVELVLAVAIISTVVHYGFLCAVFLEQYYQAEVATSKRKRKGKKSRGGAGTDQGEEAAGDEQRAGTPFPGPLSLLPFAVARRLAVFACAAPSRYRQWQRERLEAREDAERARADGQRREREAREEAERVAELRQRRVQYRLKQKQERLQDAADGDDIDWGRVPNVAEASVAANGGAAADDDDDDDDESAAATAKRPWSEEEVAALTRAFVRFPGGTLSRWEKIGAEVGRPVAEVTAQIKRLKSRVAKAAPPSAAGGLEMSKRAAHTSTRLTSDITVRTGDAATSAASRDAVQWSQDEQKLLEMALASFGRDLADRWDRVSAAVPGKSKADCMARYKHIATQLRQRKTTAATASS